MKKVSLVIVTITVLAIVSGAGLPVGEAVKMLPTGGDYNVACLDYGLEMRNGTVVKSCLLSTSGDFTTAGGQQIACAAKYSISFSTAGKVEYCTLSRDMVFRRTMKDTVECRAGGRVSFYPEGTIESARLKASVQLPYGKNAVVACRSDSPIAFRVDGNVATCILDQEGLFGSATKNKTASTCRAGSMISFDDAGAFSGCSPPTPVKETASSKAITQGGQVK